MSIQALSPLEPEQLVKPGRVNIRLMRRSGEKTMVPVSDRSDVRGMCHVQSRKPLQKYLVSGAGQTKERIRLKLGEPIVNIAWLKPLG